MLGRRLAKLRDVFVETCVNMSEKLATDSPDLAHAASFKNDGDTLGAITLSDVFLCSICEEFFTSDGPTTPLALPCGHTVCAACLGPILVRHQCCPMCRHVLTSLSPNGTDVKPLKLKDFPKNYFIVQLLSSQRSAVRPEQKEATDNFKELNTEV